MPVPPAQDTATDTYRLSTGATPAGNIEGPDMTATPIRLTVDERTMVRKAITTHPHWHAVRKILGIDSSALGTTMCVDLCDILALSIPAIVNSQTGDDMKIGTMHSADDMLPLLARWELLKHHLPQRDRDFGSSVVSTIVSRQDGAATSKQQSRLSDLVDTADMLDQLSKANGKDDSAKKDEGGFKAFVKATAEAQAQDEAKAKRHNGQDAPKAAAKTAETSGETLKAEAIPVNLDPAGAALAAMVAPHILASLTASITRMVEARLEGVQTVRLEIPRHDGSTFTTKGDVHPKFAMLLRAMSAKQANGRVPGIWIVGPASSGKTHAAEAAAEAIGLPFYTQGACSMSHELLGFVDAGGRYQRTPFRDAFENGGVCLLDELDSYDAAATLAVNAALANGVCAFPDGMVKRHADCIVLGAANTNGMGANATYVGRNRLDAAFLSRFPIKIDWPLDAALEQSISGNVAFAKRVQAARARAEAAGLKVNIDARQSAAGAALIAAGFSEKEAASMTYLAGLAPDQVRMIEGA